MNSNFVIWCSLHKCNKSTDSPPHATLIELLTEALQKHSPGGVLKKKGFLIILQNSQEDPCTGVFF